MKKKIKKIFYPSVVFVSVFVLHAVYVISKISKLSANWIDVGDTTPFSLYLHQYDYFIGLSYAFVGAFTIYAFQKFIEGRNKGSLVSAIGGIGFAGIFYFALCFLLGCYGSPMLAVYLALSGISFLGFTKPLILLITIVSVAIGIIWMNKKKNISAACCGEDEKCMDNKSGVLSKEPLQGILTELNEGMKLAKCRKCGCMKETLENMLSSFQSLKVKDASNLLKNVEQWLKEMEPIKYTCLGCKYCYPAVAMNIFNQSFPEAALRSLSCTFEVRENIWPPVPGEYFAFCDGSNCPVAVSTLASVELAKKLASIRPKELCIVGKTETENIGIDKVIKNTITNSTIRFLLLVGKDPQGHFSGKTLFALWRNGVDENMHVVGSPGKRPILRNITRQEIEKFRKQVKVIDMIGFEEEERIVEKIKEISQETVSSCSCEVCVDETESIQSITVPVIQAKEPVKVEMDKAGYFVILPQPEKKTIIVEHYSYDNKLLRVIEGEDARSIYWTIIKNGWITQLTHAAYLGKELMKAELSIKLGFKYIQDGQ